MAGGELSAVFKSLAEDADQAAGNIARTIAETTEKAADTEEANLGRTLDTEAANAKAFEDIHPGAGEPSVGSPSGPHDSFPDSPGDGIGGNNPPGGNKPADGTPTAGEPVDVSTGAMLQSQTDITLPGVLPLVIARTHKSSYRVGRWFGRSWASTLDQKIDVDVDAIHFAADDGMLLTYPLPRDDNPVLPVEGAPYRLARAADGGHTVTNRQLGQTMHSAP